MSGHGHGHDTATAPAHAEHGRSKLKMALWGTLGLLALNGIPGIAPHVRGAERTIKDGVLTGAGAVSDVVEWFVDSGSAIVRFPGRGSLDEDSSVTRLLDCDPDNSNPLTRKGHFSQSPLFSRMVLGGQMETRRGDGTKHAVRGQLTVVPKGGGLLDIDRRDYGPAKVLPGHTKTLKSGGVLYTISSQSNQTFEMSYACIDKPDPAKK